MSISLRPCLKRWGALKNLKYLDLRENELETLPDSLIELPHLEKVDARLNPRFFPPPWFDTLKSRGCLVYY
ncbi:MAG: hypothetical protein KDK62_00855 [Chlamydiia bacterium]|nr:hypothetical protein [Chlamydiia bacterium]